MSEHLLWHRLHLSAPVEPEQAKAALVALAALPGQPRVVLETFARGGRVSWRVGVRAEHSTMVTRAIRTHVPGSRLDQPINGVLDPTDIPLTAASLSLPRHRLTPLRHEAVADVTRSVFAALGQVHRGEELRLQVILGSRLRPRTVHDVDPVERRAVQVNLAEHGFDCAIRIAADADTAFRAEHLVRSLAAALRPLDVPGASFRLRSARPTSVQRATSPWFWPLHLRVSELVPLLGWPTAEPPLAGLPAPHPRLLPPHPATAWQGRRLGVATAEPTRPVAMSTTDSLRHLHVLGPSGVGKSTLLARLALQDIGAGHGVVVIDPKGDLVRDIAERIPAERLDDVVLLDPTADEVVGINGLANPRNRDLAADVYLGVIHALYADAWGPRTHDILHASLLTLARRGDASLALVPLLLTNPGFRRSVVGGQAKADPMGLGAFWAWYEGISEAERTQAIAPLMNKLRPILLRPGLRAVLGQRSPRFQLSQVFTNTKHGSKILLVSLAKGSLGPEAARLLGSLVVALVWQEALARSATPAGQRRPVWVYVDEVQDYLHLTGATSDLADALAQARSLGVGFTLAHQHLGQLTPALRTAILANARSRVAFALSPEDARAVAATTSGVLEPEDLRALPAFGAYAHLLTAGETRPPVSLTTEPLSTTRQSFAAVAARSGSRYAQGLDEIERDWLGLLGHHEATDGTDGSTQGSRPGSSSGTTDREGRVRPGTHSGSADQGRGGQS